MATTLAASPKTVLVLGNLGYIGPVLSKHLRQAFPEAVLIGFDTAFFQGCLLDPYDSAEHSMHHQIYGDIRNFPAELLQGVDCVVALAAISNDPMGKLYERPTHEINADAIVAVAAQAKAAGVQRFIFASSCSVYGAGGDKPKNEQSEVNPLTAYAISKINCEKGLEKLASDQFIVSCLRFSTACGYSPRLRLDLVLNDFVASAFMHKRIDILSDGTPWRPLIDVTDMSRAIEWAAIRDPKQSANFLAINVGAEEWNYTIKALADAVAEHLGNVQVSFNKEAPPDKRSYRVDFSLFRKLAPNHQPLKTLHQTIQDLLEGFKTSGFAQADFRNGHLIRFNTLKTLANRHAINDDLYWTS